MAENEILKLREVADCFNLTERTLYRLTQEGRLLEFKMGNAWRFRLWDIEAWIKTHKAEVWRDGGRQ